MIDALGKKLPASRLTLLIAPPKGWFNLNFKELWAYRELLYFFIWRDIKVRYKQTAIGAGWAIIQPFFTMVVFSIFFGQLAKMPSDKLPYSIFYYTALLPWMYFANALTNATTTMVDNQRIITKVYFPRIILPITSVMTGLLDFGIAFLILIGMMIYYHITVSWTILTLPLFLLLAVITALGAGLWLSALNAVYRDVRYAVTFLIQFWMFASPVAYPSSMVPEKWRLLYGLNPMAGVIEGFRWAITGHGQPPNFFLLVSVAAVIVLLTGGILFFRKMEGIIADVA